MALMGAGLLTGCMPAPATVGRASQDPFEGGIGGTGIVGLLTDFGSLKVNGLRVELVNSTRITTPFGAGSEDEIRIGTPLTILATRKADRLIARNVRVSMPLRGTVQRAPGGGWRINGVRVRPEAGYIGTLVPGQRVEAQGLWESSGLVLSRVDPTEAAEDLLAGVAAHDADGKLFIEGVPVTLPTGQLKPAIGSYASFLGQFSDGVFTARRVSSGRFPQSNMSLTQLSVEGFLNPGPVPSGYRIAGLGHAFTSGLELSRLASERSLYFGPYVGRFDARRAYVVPQQQNIRRAALSEGLEGNLSAQAIPREDG